MFLERKTLFSEVVKAFLQASTELFHFEDLQCMALLAASYCFSKIATDF